MKLDPADYDIVVTARVTVDDYAAPSLARRTDVMDEAARRQLLAEVGRRMPDDWTMDDAIYAEYVTYREQFRFATTYELKVYL